VAPVVVDAHDPSVAQREDVENLAQGLFLGADGRSARAQHDLLAAAAELDPKTVYVPGHKWQLGRRICGLYGCGLRYIDRFTGEVI
jgi:hypothetical protein